MALLRFESKDDKPRILTITDLSETSAAALLTAAQLAKAGGARLQVLHIVDMMGSDNPFRVFFDSAEDLEERVHTDGYKALEAFVTKVLGEPPEDIELKVKFGHPVDDIVRAAHFDEHIELVVAGTTGHSRIHNAIFGSTVGRIIRECDKPVMVVPKGLPDSPVRTILVPVDTSECSARALYAAAALGKSAGARVLTYSAIASPPITPYYPISPPPDMNLLDNLSVKRTAQVQEMVNALHADAVIEVIPTEHVESVVDAIFEKADKYGADLICMGTHGRIGVERAILGSTAERLIRSTKRAVLIIP